MADQERPAKSAPADPGIAKRVSDLAARVFDSCVDLLQTESGVWTRVAKDIGTILGITLVVLAVGLGIKLYLFPDEDDFLISASVVPVFAPTEISTAPSTAGSDAAKSRYWRVTGLVTDDGELANDTHVLVTFEDETGNRFAKEHDAADGRFDVLIAQRHDPELTRAPKPKLVEIHAKRKGMRGLFFGESSKTLHMSKDARAAEQNASWKEAATRPFIFVLGLFIYTALVTIIRLREGFWNRLKYYVLISLGLLFTASMIYLIGVTITSIEVVLGPDQRPTSLGFGYVFYDSYVANGPRDWNFSLTVPHEVTGLGSTANGEPASGFGAPLWVLLLSVLGAGLYTIKLVVDNVRKGSDYSEKAVRIMAADIIQHQFYILFAPLGSIFVYQFLILTGVGSKSLTVALAALASGIALNVLLKKAWDAVAEVLRTDPATSPDTGLKTNGDPVASPVTQETPTRPPEPKPS
jgi:hypothetical protein